MTSISRRNVLLGAGTAVGLSATQAAFTATTSPRRAALAADAAGLRSLTVGVGPIGLDERRTRLAKAQALMESQKIGALLVESGSTLDYFTGVVWHRSERPTAAVIPARGQPVIVTPAFEEPSVRETLQIDADVRVWNEDESPYAVVAGALRDRGSASGPVAVEGTTRFFIADGVRRAAGVETVSGDPVVRPCRMIKSAAELALMQVASNITMAALRHVHARVRPGMSQSDIAAIMDAATVALGGAPEFTLVLLNDASAYPHGSKKPQAVREGSVILMDCGCNVHGYQSDISRSWVYGTASARQRKVWNTVKRGQEIALATARIGLPAGKVDDAVRSFYVGEGWGPGYHLPGLPHRTGHGIGMDGHEPCYLVHGDPTPLQAGMCFSDEPGLYIPGAFGIRLEDCWHMTEGGPRLFSGLATSIEQPI